MSTVAIVGGTGPQGQGLGYRFARGGHDIVLGSRSAERAATAGSNLRERLGTAPGPGSVRGASNAEAVSAADLVLLAVPFEGHDELVTELAPLLAGKVAISCVNPIGFDAQGPYGLELGPTSAAENAQRLLPDTRVVGAFHHLSAATLMSEVDALHHEDVLVCGDDPEAKEAVIALAVSVTGRPGIDAGPLRMARQLEPLTAVLIAVNRRYKVRSGIALAGLG